MPLIYLKAIDMCIFSVKKNKTFKFVLDDLCISNIESKYVAFMTVWSCNTISRWRIFVYVAIELGVVACKEQASSVILCIFGAIKVCCYLDLFTSSIVAWAFSIGFEKCVPCKMEKQKKLKLINIETFIWSTIINILLCIYELSDKDIS